MINLEEGTKEEGRRDLLGLHIWWRLKMLRKKKMEIDTEVVHDASSQTTQQPYFFCNSILFFHNFFNLADFFLDFAL